MPDGPVPANSAAQSARSAVMENARAVAGAIPKPKLRSLICPFCGSPTPDTGRCKSCNARFDPLSRQATQNQMGPWGIRDEQAPFRPGCTYDTILMLIDQGVIRAETVIRGPTTRQFWTLAKHTPSISQRLGMCHNCQFEVSKEKVLCPSCKASFLPERDRQHMGVGQTRLLPIQGGQQTKAVVERAASSVAIQKIPDSAAPRTTVEHVGPSGYTDDAVEVIRLWRRAFNAERKRAWIAVGLAGLVTLIAAVSGVVGLR